MKCAIWDRAYDREYSSMFPLIFFLAELFSIGRTFGRTPPEQKYSLFRTCTAYVETQWFQHSVVTFNLNVPFIFHLTLDVTYWYSYL